MRNSRVLVFLGFLVYATVIFFLPNNWCLALIMAINFGLGLIWKVDWRRLGRGLIKLVPFILITIIFNLLLDTWENAVFVALKLVLVGQVTLSYAQTLTSLEFAKVLGTLMRPFRKIGVDTAEIELMVCITLSLLPILQENVREMRSAVLAKGRRMDLLSVRYIAQKLMYDAFRRVEELDAALMAKGVRD